MDLITVRLKSFGYSLLAFAVTGVLGFLVSPEFSALVTENFGDSVATTLVLLIVPEVVKHLRNLSVVSKFGSTRDVPLI